MNYSHPIRSAADAAGFLSELHAQGLAFHPDDPAATIVDYATGQRIFTDAEAELIDQRMGEVFAYIEPYEFLIGLMEGTE